MTRDHKDRITTFMGGVKIVRLALNYDQVQQYNPPPNPTKLTDSRAEGYVSNFGMECWELDALEPSVIVALIREAILEHRNEAAYDACVQKRESERANLADAVNHARTRLGPTDGIEAMEEDEDEQTQPGLCSQTEARHGFAFTTT
jgi:hypothetical protein